MLGSNNKRRLAFGCLGLVIISFVSIVSIILGFVAGIFLGGAQAAYPGKVLYGQGPNKIAVVHVSGIIVEETSEFSPLMPVATFSTSRQFKSLLRSIKKDHQVKGLVVRVNSPGGSAVAAEEIYQAISDFKKSGRIVVVSMGDVAASGGYYIAAAADKIVASPATLTGSIGVIAEITNLSGLYEKLGLRSEVYKSGEFKDIFNPLRERTAEEKAMLQETLDTTYQLFLERVSSGRGLLLNEAEDLAAGRIYSGAKAREVGLVDELGGFEEAVNVAKNLAGITEAQVVEYRQESLMEILFGGISSLNPLNIFSPLFRPLGVSVKYLFVY